MSYIDQTCGIRKIEKSLAQNEFPPTATNNEKHDKKYDSDINFIYVDELF